MRLLNQQSCELLTALLLLPDYSCSAMNWLLLMAWHFQLLLIITLKSLGLLNSTISDNLVLSEGLLLLVDDVF
ncbi:MAG: hypothetical protein CL693_17960 [Cellvibrionaceae bacterium]|nr:hypothetical protein [Cellvibrionaceae bacterium]